MTKTNPRKAKVPILGESRQDSSRHKDPSAELSGRPQRRNANKVPDENECGRLPRRKQIWTFVLRFLLPINPDSTQKRLESLAKSPLFDADWYLKQNPDVQAKGLDPAKHYIVSGGREGRDPHPLFCHDHYIRSIGGFHLLGEMTPVEHYAAGPVDGPSPHPAFDVQYYLEQCQMIQSPALIDYLASGWQDGLRPSPYFDPDIYPLATKGSEPLSHFLQQEPVPAAPLSDVFDSGFYLENNQDVREAGFNPLLHFILSGQAEGRAGTREDHHRQIVTISPERTEQRKLLGILSLDSGNQRRWIAGNIDSKKHAKTILLVGHTADDKLYGGERSLVDVLTALDAIGYNVIVTLPSDQNTGYIETVRRAAVGIYILPYRQWFGNRVAIERIIFEFQAILNDHAVDALHANTITHLEPLEAARRNAVPRIIHVRELPTLDRDLCQQIGLPAEDIIASVIRRSDFLIANSKATATSFPKPERTFVIYNGIDVNQFSPSRAPNHQRPLRFGIISSNTEKKGVADVIALAQNLGERDDLELVVIGPETDDINQWKQAVADGLLPSTLRFLGYKSTPQHAMKELDVLLTVSHFAESFGRTVAEAAACAKPSIGYHWGAIPEIIQNHETGILVEYRDINALANAVRHLTTYRDNVPRLGEAARKRVETLYSTTSLHQAMDEAYTRIFNLHPRSRRTSRLPLAAVVPIFNAYEETKLCLESLKTHAPDLKAILVNDGSTDQRIDELLSSFKKDERFQVLTNTTNQGYTRSINKAIAHATGHDIVLVNSDVRVTPYWLEGLLLAADTCDRVGTVTAMSNNAGAFSFPVEGELNPIPSDMDDLTFARLVIQAAGQCAPVEVPTGSGFCMYIRRALFDEIGTFDETGFPRGYGEENDFCLRAIQAGWTNLISPWSYVFHKRTASFGQEKETLMRAGVEELLRRYPDYVERVTTAFASSPIANLRTATYRVYQ